MNAMLHCICIIIILCNFERDKCAEMVNINLGLNLKLFDTKAIAQVLQNKKIDNFTFYLLLFKNISVCFIQMDRTTRFSQMQ